MFAEPDVGMSLLYGHELERTTSIDVEEVETEIDDDSGSPCRELSSATPTTSDAVVLAMESSLQSSPICTTSSKSWGDVLTPKMLRRSNGYNKLDRPLSIHRTNRKQPKKKHVSVSDESDLTSTNTHAMVNMPDAVAISTLEDQCMDGNVLQLEEMVVLAARKLNFEATTARLKNESSSDFSNVHENTQPGSNRRRIFSLADSPPQTRPRKPKRVKKNKRSDRDRDNKADIYADADADTKAIQTPSQQFQILQRAAITSTVPAPLFEGYLTKQGKFRRNWKKRWCIIDEAGTIRYYKQNESVERGLIDPFCQDGNPDNMFKENQRASTRQSQAQTLLSTGTELDAATTWPSSVPDPRCRFAINANGRTYFFFADNVTQAGRWKKLLKMFDDRYNSSKE